MAVTCVTQSSRATRTTAVIGLLAVAAFAAAPWWAGSANLRLFGEVFLYLALASLWKLLAGYAGLVSVGQQAYVSLGGYLLFALTMFAGLHPLVAVLVATVATALVAMPVTALIFRLHGAYFAIGTWVVAEVFRLSFAQVSALGGGSGTSLPVGIVKAVAEAKGAREAIAYWCALAASLVVLATVYLLLRSRRGLALTAIRDNELAARSLGIDIWSTKFFVYVLTAGLTGAIGALIFLQKLGISPDAAFSVNDWTAFVIFIVVIGGIGTVEGPILGVLVFFLLRETLADFGPIYLMLLGTVAILVMLRVPTGLWGLIRNHTDLQLFPLRRTVVVDS